MTDGTRLTAGLTALTAADDDDGGGCGSLGGDSDALRWLKMMSGRTGWTPLDQGRMVDFVGEDSVEGSDGTAASELLTAAGVGMTSVLTTTTVDDALLGASVCCSSDWSISPSPPPPSKTLSVGSFIRSL